MMAKSPQHAQTILADVHHVPSGMVMRPGENDLFRCQAPQLQDVLKIYEILDKQFIYVV